MSLRKIIIALILAPSLAFAGGHSHDFEFTGYRAWGYYVYAKADLNGVISKDIFMRAFEEYSYLKKDKNILTIIDYSKPSSKKRFFVIDVDDPKLLFNTYVSHGIESGDLYATKFSNKINSYQTSLGTFRTAETYIGRNGYSLRIDGLDKGVNDNARRRYIVVHGASYSMPFTIKATGMLGRSQGCPSLPKNIAKKVIDTIKGGSIIYSYGIPVNNS